MNTVGASGMEVSPPDYVVSKEWNIHKQYVYAGSWHHKWSFPWESESCMTFTFDRKKHLCVPLAQKTTGTCIAAILLCGRWEKCIWKRLKNEDELGHWIGKSLVGNVSNASSVILTWDKNTSLNSLVGPRAGRMKPSLPLVPLQRCVRVVGSSVMSAASGRQPTRYPHPR